METRIFAALGRVRKRQRLQSIIAFAILGLLFSGMVGIGVGIWKSAAMQSFPLFGWIAILVTGPILGCVVGTFWRQSWKRAATAVDSHYKLKDRSITAISFIRSAEDNLLHKMQVDEAGVHLAKVQAGEVSPFRLPYSFPFAITALALAIVLLIQNTEPAVAAPTPTNPILLDVRDNIKDSLKELAEEFAKDEDVKEEIEKLVKELREKSDKIKEEGIDVKEVLATISEMEAKIAAKQAQYNAEMVDNQLKSLGQALASAESMKGVGQKLQKGDFEKAAKDLEELKNPKLSNKERKAVAERTKKTAKMMKKSGLGQLGDAASELSDGIESGQSGKISKGSKNLSKAVKKHRLRKKINRLLMSELDKLSESKSLCLSCGSCSKCGGKCKGGSCSGGKNSLAKGKNPKKSTSPSNSFGMSTSGNLFGDKTALQANRNLMAIKGQTGDGPSEIETTNSPEGRENARRKYRKSFKKYKKLSDAVLDREPIPLGHRRTIRKYFELIRPNGKEADAKTKTKKVETKK